MNQQGKHGGDLGRLPHAASRPHKCELNYSSLKNQLTHWFYHRCGMRINGYCLELTTTKFLGDVLSLTRRVKHELLNIKCSVKNAYLLQDTLHESKNILEYSRLEYVIVAR